MVIKNPRRLRRHGRKLSLLLLTDLTHIQRKLQLKPAVHAVQIKIPAPGLIVNNFQVAHAVRVTDIQPVNPAVEVHHGMACGKR